MKAPHTAHEIAQYLLWRAAQENPEDPTYLTPLQLQKLLYYVQGWNMAETGSPAFREEVRAWRYGPVVKSVFDEFRHLEGRPITERPDAPPDLTPPVRSMVESVWNKYKGFSPIALANMTHEEMPWKRARGDLPKDAPSDKLMPLSDLRSEFMDQLEAAQRRLVAHARRVRAFARGEDHRKPPDIAPALP